MTETTFTREQVLETLIVNPTVNVYFTKLDGSYREMNCTLDPDTLRLYTTVSTEQSEYDDNQIRVFDLNIKEWRSFLLTNLIEIRVN